MKRLLLILSLLNVGMVNAQSVSKQYVDYTRVSGSFYYNVKVKGVEQRININYCLYPAPFYGSMTMALSTADDLSMKANIVNSAGKVVLRWVPAGTDYRYENQFDLSSLPAGKYYVDVYAGNSATKSYSIPFEKLSDK